MFFQMVTKCANQSFTCRKTREAYTSKINCTKHRSIAWTFIADCRKISNFLLVTASECSSKMKTFLRTFEIFSFT